QGRIIPGRTMVNALNYRDEGHRRAGCGVLRQRLQLVAWTGAPAHAVPQETAVSASVARACLVPDERPWPLAAGRASPSSVAPAWHGPCRSADRHRTLTSAL